MLLSAGLASGSAPAHVSSHASHTGHGSAAAPDLERRRAVGAANLRVDLGYEFLHVDETETSSFGASTNTLRIPDLDGHAGRVAIVGTFPLTFSTGVRGRVHARHGDSQRSVDGLERGNNEATAYGAGLELFVRDPALFALTAGGAYERQDGEGSVSADAYSGSAELALFFPDLGLGPLDWVVRFDFTHRQVSGVSGPSDLDADRYRVTGSAGWYWTDDFQFVLGGRWDRAEEEFLNEEDREGFAQIRWRIPGPVSVELSLLGSAGVSEYKQPPFEPDHRLAYGAEAGLTFRFRSGRTLLESIRGYD